MEAAFMGYLSRQNATGKETVCSHSAQEDIGVSAASINRSISHVDPGLRSIVPVTAAAGKVDRLQPPRLRLNRLWPGVPD